MSSVKRRRGLYDKEQLISAIRAVEEKKMTSTKAAKVYGVPSSTIRSHLNNSTLCIGAGRPFYLNKKKESYLVELIKSLSLIGVRLTLVILYKLVGEYLCLVSKVPRLHGTFTALINNQIFSFFHRQRTKSPLDEGFLEQKQERNQVDQREKT